MKAAFAHKNITSQSMRSISVSCWTL